MSSLRFEEAVRTMFANGISAPEIKAEVDRVIAKVSAETAAKVFARA